MKTKKSLKTPILIAVIYLIILLIAALFVFKNPSKAPNSTTNLTNTTNVSSQGSAHETSDAIPINLRMNLTITTPEHLADSFSIHLIITDNEEYFLKTKNLHSCLQEINYTDFAELTKDFDDTWWSFDPYSTEFESQLGSDYTSVIRDFLTSLPDASDSTTTSEPFSFTEDDTSLDISFTFSDPATPPAEYSDLSDFFKKTLENPDKT